MLSIIMKLFKSKKGIFYKSKLVPPKVFGARKLQIWGNSLPTKNVPKLLLKVTSVRKSVNTSRAQMYRFQGVHKS